MKITIKSQVSTEYLFILGLIILALIPIIYYATQESSRTLNLNDAQDAVQTLARTADYVYSLGPGTRSIALITIPTGVYNTRVLGREVIINLSGYKEVSAFSKANLTGGFPSTPGTYNVPVTLLENGVVLIGDLCNNNNICEYAEDCSNCPNDCTCAGGLNCCGGICSIPQCTSSLQCNDNNACTTNTCQNPGTCVAYCAFAPINTCINGDGCCPANCNLNNDSDCASGVICGDNICSPGETCYECATDCTVCGGEPPGPIAALLDIGISQGLYLKTDGLGLGLNTKDSQMSSIENITLDLLDDNVNTPPATSVIRTRTSPGQGSKYESFSVLAFRDTTLYSQIVLYGRVAIADENPFKIRIYPYLQDKDTIDVGRYMEYAINPAIINQPVKWIELDITPIAKRQDGYGFIKVRITSLNATAQDNDRFQFSELHYKVG